MTSAASRSRVVRDSRRSIFERSAETADSAEGGGRVRCKRAVRRPTNGLALAGPKAQGSATKMGRPGGAARRDARRCGSPIRKTTPGRRRFPGEGTEHDFMRCCQGGNVRSERIKSCSVSAADAQCSSVRNRACGTVLPAGPGRAMPPGGGIRSGEAGRPMGSYGGQRVCG